MTTKKTHKAQEVCAVYGSAENRNSSDCESVFVPILKKESEQFSTRLNEVIGDEQQRAFARRTNISDGVMRAYLAGKSLPGMTALISISEATGVTIDWLATGRLPKTRAELRQAQPAPAAPSIDPERLRLALTITDDSVAATGQTLTADQHADMVLAVYQRLYKGEPS